MKRRPISKKALQNQPNNPNIRSNLRMALAKTETTRDEEAMIELRNTLETHPDFADARRSLAVILLQKGRVGRGHCPVSNNP